jgi:hypothetical protein
MAVRMTMAMDTMLTVMAMMVMLMVDGRDCPCFLREGSLADGWGFRPGDARAAE